MATTRNTPAVPGSTKPPGVVVPTPPAEIPPEVMKRANKIANNWTEFNRGGAPVSPEFVAAALQQGLEASDIKMILRSQALGGPQTSASYSSPELLDYYTQNPGQIGALMQAVRSTHEAPATYAEYLAQGGEPGAYRARNQLLQEAVLSDPGAREAYLSGTSRQQYIDAGNDPNRWATDQFDWMDRQAAAAQPKATPDLMGQLDQFGNEDIMQLSDAASQLLTRRQQKQAAMSTYQQPFGYDEVQ